MAAVNITRRKTNSRGRGELNAARSPTRRFCVLARIP
jgi:hypothetical protein